MASEHAKPLARGEYAPSKATDLRSPCPMVNCLANHGYIPRDGRNVTSDELGAAMNEIGLSALLGGIFSQPIFLERWASNEQPHRSFVAKIRYLLQNPWAIAMSSLGLRPPGQQDTTGQRILDLNQIGLHGVIEHDVSLTRRDFGQKKPDGSGTYDGIAPDPDLVNDLLQCPADKSKNMITIEDLAQLRKRRIENQRENYPSVEYGATQHRRACGEIALILGVLGDGKSVPCDYARAFFLEERLPIKEGWRKRRWWSFGLVELEWTVGKVKKLVGLTI